MLPTICCHPLISIVLFSCFSHFIVYREGDPGTSWYIILKGSVSLVMGGKASSLSPETNAHVHISLCVPAYACVIALGDVFTQVMCTLSEGDDFGRLALVNNAPRTTSIQLREPNCCFLRVDSEDYRRSA